MAERAAGLLTEVQTTRPARLPSVQRLANLEPDLSAVLRMTDATGMLQHSIYSIPDRLHGYCLDDNARALILINHMPGMDEGERDRLTSIYASFVQHARSEEHTSELQSLMRISYAVFCLTNNKIIPYMTVIER